MSTPQPSRVCVIAVDRETADVLRLEAKKVMVFNHELFEDLLEFGPEAQRALAMRFRDASDLIDVVGIPADDVEEIGCVAEAHRQRALGLGAEVEEVLEELVVEDHHLLGFEPKDVGGLAVDGDHARGSTLRGTHGRCYSFGSCPRAVSAVAGVLNLVGGGA